MSPGPEATAKEGQCFSPSRRSLAAEGRFDLQSSTFNILPLTHINLYSSSHQHFLDSLAVRRTLNESFTGMKSSTHLRISFLSWNMLAGNYSISLLNTGKWTSQRHAATFNRLCPESPIVIVSTLPIEISNQRISCLIIAATSRSPTLVCLTRWPMGNS